MQSSFQFMPIGIRFCVGLALVLLSASIVFAAPPNAGQLLQEQQQNQQQLQSSSQVKVTSQSNQIAETSQGPRIMVKGFRFVGDTRVLNAQSLQHVVRDYIGKNLTFGEIQQVADLVSLYLRNKGYAFARAYLEAQQVQNGVVEITILLGKVEKQDIIINGTKLRIGENQLHQTLARPQ